MKTLIVGGGPSGLLSAILLKQKNINHEVIVIEKEERLGKKIYVSGNGRCNLFNYTIGEELFSAYRHDQFSKNIIDSARIINTLISLGIDIRKEGNLGYPYTEQARTVMDVFNYHLKTLKVDIKTKTELVDYYVNKDKIIVMTTNEKIEVDNLIIASGGKSMPVHGSNGAIFTILKKHGYHITPLYPGLVPIKVKEELTSLKGTRVKCLVSLLKNKEIIKQELGEVQFKDDALGGIAMMNMSSIIARMGNDGYFQISLDLLPEYNYEDAVAHLINKQERGYPYLDGSICPSLARYVESRTVTKGKKNYEEILKVVKEIKNLKFTVDGLYSFNNSQVTVGGVDIEEINEDLSSKKEKGVYFVGEVIDNDGLCGGYNLMWCFATSLKVVNKID